MRHLHRILPLLLLASVALCASARSASAACVVTDYGATGNGVTDDRVAVQSAINACSASGDREVYFPAGTYSLSRAGSAYYCLNVPSGMRLRGAGQAATVLAQAAGLAGSVRLLYVSGDDDRIEDLTLDGNKANQSADEHRAGIFATATNRLLVQHVTARNFTGDGFYLYTGANQSTFFDVLATGNTRDGLVFGASVDGAQVVSSRFIGNGAQQIDSEPGAGSTVRNISITGSTLDGAGVSNDYVLTCSGTGSASRGSGWNVVGNTLNGGVFVVWTDHVVIASNVGVNPTTKACFTAYRASSDVTIEGNTCQMTQTTVNSLAGVLISGTGAGNMPDRIIVAHNNIKMDYPQSFGVRAEGARSVEIVGNVLRGGGRASATFYAGIHVRATIEAEDFRSAVLQGNIISNFGARGIGISGNGAARLLALDVSGNTFDDDQATPSMLTGISLDDGTGAAKEITMIGNQCLGGVATPVASYPAQAVVLIGGTRGAHAIYSVVGTPEGQVSAPVGALAIRRDGGSGTTLYAKESGGNSSTGWVAR